MNGVQPLPAGAGGAPESAATVRSAPKTAAGFKTVYFFKGAPDGGNSYVGLTAANGLLYGTTFHGGDGDNGTLYQVSPTGAEKVLYHFQGGEDGSHPYATPTYIGGLLYGDTSSGGGGPCAVAAYGVGCGTIFTIDKSGKEQVLYRFQGANTGATPQSTLLDVNGELYSTGVEGGTRGRGFVFKLKGTQYQVVYSFHKGGDGWFPVAGLAELNGRLYGSTLFGGGNANGCPKGCGVVFDVTTSGAEHVIHQFKNNGVDGTNPWGTLIAFGGKLYGTTWRGGKDCGGPGCGVIFEMGPNGQEHILHNFGAGEGSPVAALTPFNGDLYGVTATGGLACASGLDGRCGVVFKLSASGAYSVVHEFSGSDGADPNGTLVVMNGHLYGTTLYGGNSGCYYNRGCGTVFEVTP
jgi:uncharacterized repeat protein (TIGR03803 family)